MSTIQPTDLTVINRAGVDYRTPVTMSTVQETDLLLVNRGGVDYKCTFADWKAAYVPPASINKPRITSPANGAGQTTTPLTDALTGATGNTLTFASDKGLSDFTPGMTVYQTLTGGPVLNGQVFENNINALPALNTPPSSVEKLVVYTKADFGSAWTLAWTYASSVTSAAMTIYGANNKNGPWLRRTSYGTGSLGTAVNFQTLIADTYIAFEAYVVTPSVGGGRLAFTLTNPPQGEPVYLDIPHGVVQSVNGNTITLSSSSGTWTVGETVSGPTSTSADAALGKTPTFTSSAFAITGSGITHGSSDWQVTLKADTGFASPVVQSMADATNLVRWDGGPLQPNTDYIVRVRHNGGGKSSPWSDVVSFKTKTTFP